MKIFIHLLRDIAIYLTIEFFSQPLWEHPFQNLKNFNVKNLHYAR